MPDSDLGAFTPGDDFGYDDSWLVDPSQLYQPGGGYTDPGAMEGSSGSQYEGNQIVNPGDIFSPGGGGGGKGFDIMSVLRSLGLATGKGDNSSLLPLLAALGIGGNALLNRSAAKDAANFNIEAAKTANADIAKLMSGSGEKFSPYTTAGASAAALAPGLAYKPVAGNFKPLGSGAALTFGDMAKRGR